LGSARTRWGAYSAPPDRLAGLAGREEGMGVGKQGRGGRGGKGGEKGKGRIPSV